MLSRLALAALLGTASALYNETNKAYGVKMFKVLTYQSAPWDGNDDYDTDCSGNPGSAVRTLWEEVGQCMPENEARTNYMMATVNATHFIKMRYADANCMQPMQARHTQKGCLCKPVWEPDSNDQPLCTTGCCNPDNDVNGDWCNHEDEECEGPDVGSKDGWGYCAAAGGAVSNPAYGPAYVIQKVCKRGESMTTSEYDRWLAYSMSGELSAATGTAYFMSFTTADCQPDSLVFGKTGYTGGDTCMPASGGLSYMMKIAGEGGNVAYKVYDSMNCAPDTQMQDPQSFIMAGNGACLEDKRDGMPGFYRAWAWDPTTPAPMMNPAENVEMLTVKTYKGAGARGCDDERFLTKSFQPVGQCMRVEVGRADGGRGPAFVKGALGELASGQRAYMEQFYLEDTCVTPLWAGPNATVTSECTYNIVMGKNEWKIGMMDSHVATVYLETFSSPGCAPESMDDREYWGLDVCEPRPMGDDGWGKHTSLIPDGYESLTWWVTRGNAEVFFFKSRDCSGRAAVAEDGSAMRTGGGVCTQYPMADAKYPGYYKAWTFKRQEPMDFGARARARECVMLARDVAERIRAVEHPDKMCPSAPDATVSFDQDRGR